MALGIKQRRWLYIGLSILTLCLVSTLTPVKASSPVTTIPNLVSSQSQNWLEAGRKLYQSGRFTEAINAWQTAVKQYQKQGDRSNQALTLSYLSLAQQELNQLNAAQQSVREALQLLKATKPAADAILWAQALNTQASLQLHTGQAELALENWQQAQKYYEKAGDQMGSLGSQINQAQALQSLGFYRRSRKQLEALNQKLMAMPDSEIKVNGLRSLGVTLQLMGIAQQSQATLKESLKTAKRISVNTEISAILQTLGKTAMDLKNPNAALTYFEQAEEAANSPQEKFQSRLDRFNLFVDYGVYDYAIPLIPQLWQQLQELPPTHTSLNSRINFIATLNKLENPSQFIPLNDLGQMLGKTVKEAGKIEDKHTQAYALKQWGEFYRATGQVSQAQKLTQQSLNIARQLQADDIIAQSAWQLGGLYKQQNQTQEAIATYTEAVNALQAIRTDLVAVNPDVQFSFRESVEPVYRELVGLLLEGEPNQGNLVKARDLIEALQVAELDNFLREVCLDKAQQIDQIDPTATVIYPIILPDRLAVIYSSAGQPLSYHVINKTQVEVEQTLKQLLGALNPVSDIRERNRLSQQIYDWLIRPGETQSVFKQTKTLVFVLDGILRNIPMSALYDGQQYLIEKYAVTLSPGLQLMAAQSLESNKIEAVVGGISEARFGFAPLPAVESEIKEISQKVRSVSTLLNEKLTEPTLADRMKNSSANVVHLATHGQFSSRLDETFLLTWDGKVNIKELSELLQNRQNDRSKELELLVLSACDTATGDNRAVLGLAGLAVKSGARSTIASLWPVNDKAAVPLMTNFYDKLRQPGINKAEALRQAQIEMIQKTDFREPFFWSAFVLVGNWQ
ncbi:MAG: CHAT domain-containing protein [Nostocaceae cyanobacterium]|nr:CHAT domain-containing protein [Nostocaceae cyanobacterium]